MSRIQEIYRADYDGEYVVLNTKIEAGKKIIEKEWVDNPIQNQHISGRAAVIASGESRLVFDVARLERHRGGLLGSKKLQTYGTGQLHKEMQLDFFITLDPDKLKECIEDKYTERCTVYSTARNCIENPGEFFLIPQSMMGLTAVLATWLACFDGHKEIFWLGLDGQMDENYNNNVYIPKDDARKTSVSISYKLNNSIAELMQCYLGVDFYHVSNIKKVPEVWLEQPNFKQMTYREWISYCDVQ